MPHRMPKTSETQPSDDSRTIKGRWWLAVTNRLRQHNRIETQFRSRSNRTEHSSIIKLPSKSLLAATAVHHPDTRSNEFVCVKFTRKQAGRRKSKFTDTRTNARAYGQTGSLAHNTAVLSSRNPISLSFLMAELVVVVRAGYTSRHRPPLSEVSEKSDFFSFYIHLHNRS